MPLPIPPFPRLPACEPSRRPMYKCAQHLLHHRRHHPCLCPKQQHLLHHRLEEVTRNQFLSPSLLRIPCSLPQLFLAIFQSPRHRRPVVIPLYQYPPQVFEPRYCLYLLSVDLEGHLRAVPDLRLRQSSSLLVRPPPAHLCALVAAVEGPPRDEHVTICASGMGEVSLLQYDDDVPHMPPLEVNPHRRPCP